MSRIGVKFQNAWWDVVVSRSKEPRPLTPVWLTKGEERGLLCQVQNNDRFGWTVVVSGDVNGPRLVQGFKTRWQAIQYAIEIRIDINPTEESWN